MDNKAYHISKWVGNKEKFQELYKEFKRSISNGNVLKFLKEKIFEPNNIQYKNYNDYLEIYNLKDNKIYLFLYAIFDDIDLYDDPFENPIYDEIIDIALEKIENAFNKNKTFKIEQYRAYVIGKNAIAYVFTDRWGYERYISYFFNRNGECKPDDHSFAKFLRILTKRGIIKK